ncbi:hypothetical protein ACFHW2_11775 [Actinomadura sp. LOL_016]|uniref:hypothetical protein n=1 Tax=unclassified Actinomadura TaxID=2626254 RepID=UPI003A80698F
MPITYRDGVFGSDVEGLLALTIPATVQAGDLMLVTWHVALDTAPINLPPGWAYLPDGTVGTHQVGTSRAAGIFKIASGGDAESSLSLAVTAGAPVKQSAVLTAWAGCDQTNPIHKATFSSSQSLSGTSHTSPQVVTTLDGCVLVESLSCKDSSVGTITAPSGYTARGSVTMTGGGRSSTAQASKDASTGGTWGGESWTTDAIPSSICMFAVALAPQLTTQTARPVSDVTVTNVTDQNGGDEDLYAAIDETALDLNDYVRAVVGGVYEAQLGALTTPPGGIGVQVDYVLGVGNGATSATWDVYVLDGTTEVAHWVDEITADNTPVSHVLTGGEFDEISSWSNLRIRWVLTDVAA